MQTTRKFWLTPLALAALMGLGAATVQADSAQAMHGSHMLEGLELSDAQREQLRSVREQHRQALDNAEDSTQRRELKHQHKNALQSILTPEQRDALQARREERAERHFNRLTKRLELTDAQQPRVKALMQQTRAEMHERLAGLREQAEREDWSPEQRRQAMKAARREQMQALQQRLADVLSDAQLEQLERMHQRHDKRDGRHYHGNNKHQHGERGQHTD